MNTEKIEMQSHQVKLIREMQASDGQAMCYATNVAKDCSITYCPWRYDCFDDSLCDAIPSPGNFGASQTT
jgi:hypothetical protein